MLTGDNEAVAHAVAGEVPVSEVRVLRAYVATTRNSELMR
jgi:hypothetical protein